MMESAGLEVLQHATDWLDQGRRIALATVVGTWGSSPRPAGSMLAIRDDGRLAGSVSGGCVEADLAERVVAGRIGTLPETIVYGVTREEAGRFGLPCGGTLRLVVEPAPHLDNLRELRSVVEQRRVIARHLDLRTGTATLQPAEPGDEPVFGGTTLVTVHGPSWRLFIIGAGQPSRYLAQMAQALDYQVIVCDPRQEYADAWDIAGTELVMTMPDDAVAAYAPDRRSAVVALTHDPKLDDLALLEALKSGAFYIGALGSRANNTKRRERLALFDLTPTQLTQLHGPVGLPIGSRTPPEIAVSILAEMTALRRGAAVSRPPVVAATESLEVCP